MGAIGDPSVISVLEEYSKDPTVEVAETCQLALDRLKWKDKNDSEKVLSKNPYASVDPAPPLEQAETNVAEVQAILLDENRSLFDRYRAMFTLRNLRTKESTLALGEGIDKLLLIISLYSNIIFFAALKVGSALFRHEVAFVLGQLQEEVSVPHLQASLEDASENEMVRHECAEALGAIATPECLSILNKYLEDNKRVVSESCAIALDMCEYENSLEFQYANTLSKVSS